MRLHSFLVIVSLCVPTFGAAQQSASMTQFTIAKSQVSDFASELGSYDACLDLVSDIRENGIVSDYAATLKVLYQGAVATQKIRLTFLEKLERAGYSFEQMFMLDDLLTSEFNASKGSATRRLEAYDRDYILVTCSQVRTLPAGY